MRGRALVYKPGQREPEVTELTRPENGSDEAVQLAWLHEQLGGSLEIVPHFNMILHEEQLYSCVAFCNDDGKREPLPFNLHATALWNAAVGGGLIGPDGRAVDYLVGNIVVLIGDREFMASL